ncbi:Lar family restriction alleviation protein [Sulfitobacter sp. 1A13679]|uniref:Lar family restriction alleviation protein n=1 Tax=Sulfitobacter sp. 1A13679 TaxID=3368597 RepID=UPI00374692C7
MTEHLKPCPFCGGKANMTTEACLDGGGRFAYVRCSQCKAKSREHYHSYGNDCPVMYQTIRDEWNTRTALTPTPQEAAR